MDLKQADPEIHSFLGENEKRMNKVAIPLRMEGENKEDSQAENPLAHHYYIFSIY